MVPTRLSTMHGEANQSGASAVLRRSCVVRPAGIEPATPAFGGQYSIH
jgi:hypothetical protein